MRRLVLTILIASALFGACGDDTQGPDVTPQKREHEILTERPSGFWTSNKKAEGGSYRWRLLGIGIALVVITGTGITLLIRKANAERKERDRDEKDRDDKGDDNDRDDPPRNSGDGSTS